MVRIRIPNVATDISIARRGGEGGREEEEESRGRESRKGKEEGR